MEADVEVLEPAALRMQVKGILEKAAGSMGCDGRRCEVWDTR
jgi:hypothetical protein